MGLWICSEHGKQGIRNVCSHLGEAVRQKQQIHSYIEISCVITELVTVHFHYCSNCIERLHLPKEGGAIDLPEDEDKAEKMLGPLDYVCGGCFNEAIGKEVIRWDYQINTGESF
jgi:hypothetical protein